MIIHRESNRALQTKRERVAGPDTQKDQQNMRSGSNQHRRPVSGDGALPTGQDWGPGVPNTKIVGEAGLGP